jgi:hypothetical protein
VSENVNDWGSGDVDARLRGFLAASALEGRARNFVVADVEEPLNDLTPRRWARRFGSVKGL